MAWTNEYHALSRQLPDFQTQLLLLFFEVHHWFQICLNFRSFLAMLPRNFYEDQKIKANLHEDRITLEST